ncbi:MAG: Rossmann-like domain-containing protein, partial [Chloroflexota bacterium]
MALIEDLLATVKNDAPVQEVRIGAFWTAVVSARCGLAGTLLDAAAVHGQAVVQEAGRLHESGALALTALAKSTSALERSVGVAALNSLLPVDEARCVELNAGDLLAEKGRGKVVALVGHFPFIPRLRQQVGSLSVLELRPQEGDLPAEEATRVVPEADVVAITGSALLNGTLQGLLDLCHPDAFVVVLGPTTPLSPVLFDYGVDVVSGTLVVDPEQVLTQVSQG